MAYSMSVSLVSPSDTATDQAISTNLELSYTGTILPWEYWVGGVKKLSYPVGSMWDSKVNPTQLGIPGNAWVYETTYSWHVRYAHTAATRTWVTDHWEFTGLEYTNTATWTFTTEGLPTPSKPINPVPADEATGITLDDTTVSWEDGGGADTYDVYFRMFGASYTKIASDTTDLFASTLEALYDPVYAYGFLYFWYVVAKNEYGETEGDEWYFNAMEFDPPLPFGMTLSYAGDDDGVPTGTPTGGNFIRATKKLVAVANNKIWIEEL